MSSRGEGFTIEVIEPIEANARLIMDWRNDPATLEASYHQNPKIWECFWSEFQSEYFKWERLSPIFVVRGGQRVAFLRFRYIQDPKGRGRPSSDISIIVNPDERGRGIGPKAIEVALEYLGRAGISVAVAEMRLGNRASIRAFEKAGFGFLEKATKHIADTNESCEIFRYLKEFGLFEGGDLSDIRRKRGGACVLFDLDGTLANSLGLMEACYFEFLSEFGIAGSSGEFAELNGPPLGRVVEILKNRYSLAPDFHELLRKYNSSIRDKYLDVLPHSGAVDSIVLASRLGWICAVVTSNSERIARDWLQKQGLMPFIAEIIGRESVQTGKPDPEPYSLALTRLNCSPRVSLAIEDSNSGLESAMRAGLRALAYCPKEIIAKSQEAVGVITSFEELRPWLVHA